MPGLADEHGPRLAPGVVEDRRGDEVVVEDHVGVAQCPERFQRQQLGIPRPGADEGHGPALRRRLGLPEEFRKVVRLGRAVGFGEGALGEALPEEAPLGEAWEAARDLLPPIPRSRHPAGEAARQHRLDPGADGLAEDGGGALGGDAHHQRRAVDDGAELHVAEMRTVHSVDDGSRRAGGGDEGHRVHLVLHGADAEGRAPEVVRGPGALVQGDGAVDDLAGHAAQLLRGLGGVDIDMGPGGGEHLHLPRRPAGGARQHHPLAAQRHEDRQHRERFEPGGTGLAGGTGGAGGGRVGHGHASKPCPDPGLILRWRVGRAHYSGAV